MSKYSKKFKEEAIRLSDEIGNKKATLFQMSALLIHISAAMTVSWGVFS